mmetsp:Transcript_10992/g.16600  ORF Transcript_10992/g.16600 Transcript_10992/m.16600 type:complete len:274 (-) Transcript_10992:176-997(-)|eukprot:CAMPEP_0116014542 /NCGR_PEP_ID=MMETSP0321-20121206/6328_1 /TAXON_ID=163516 /ORGANISM="Leptocylindrus danicus var. danicus, Strain B650" /LENGTH=273 /DNA_ID=CAMNT_0003484191 /DNA_START=8 /DNA_END=829 /DNA_ORIENTATION=+
MTAAAAAIATPIEAAKPSAKDEGAISTLKTEIAASSDEFLSTLPGNFDIQVAKEQVNTISADDQWLLRLLVARKFDMKKTVSLFQEQVYWRTKWQPWNIKPSDISTAMQSGAWRLCGKTRDGAPICNYKLKNWNPDEYDLDEYIKFVAYMLDLFVSEMTPGGPTQFVCLFDLEGFTVSLIRQNVREMIRKLIYVAQAQHPERLRHVFLMNAPWGFSTAWTLISPLLDAKTAAKAFFLTGPDYSQSLDGKANISPSVLSEYYGGGHAEYPLPHE